MIRSVSLLVAIGVIFATLGIVAGHAQKAEAQIIPFPFFTPIAECGTVITVPSVFPPETECIVWKADSGGAYIVSGIEAFDIGDRVFVDGLVCNTCLTTCFAGAILNATITDPCP